MVKPGLATTGRAIAEVLSMRPVVLPFPYFKRWEMHDFHTSRWTRFNPSAQIKRTRLGRSSIDQPTMNMVSVSRYGGNVKRANLAKAFRVYRSVDPSEAMQLCGWDAIRSITFDDFGFAETEEKDLALDFVCLYLNACVLLKLPPSKEMMTKLSEELAKSVETSFHWECVLCALHNMMYPKTTETALTASTTLTYLTQGAGLRAAAECLSQESVVLMLLATARALAVVMGKTSGNPSRHEEPPRCERVEHLLAAQSEALRALPSNSTPAKEAVIAAMEAICWRHAAGGSAPEGSTVAFLTSHGHSLLPSLGVENATRLFGALCATLSDAADVRAALDPVALHLEQHVRVHRAADVAVVLAALLASEAARRRYKKLPIALLDHMRAERECGRFDQEDPVIREALGEILRSLASGDDNLADVATVVVNTDLGL